MKRWQKVLAIVAAAVIVAVVALSLVLDSILTSKAREEAQKLSQQWGRPVAVGGVSTKLITGLGVRVSDVQIGAAQGEGAPLLDLKRIEVRMALLRAALSRGKSVEINSAEVQGLTLNIVKLPDGSTNLEKLQEKMTAGVEPKKEEPAEKTQTDLSFLRVDHAALREGKVVFIDRTKGAQRELSIQHLEVTVDDLRAGKPLEIVLKAAVLAEKQNLELRLKTAPLPETLAPTPTTLVLRVDPPIDMGALGPFLGKDVGLESGTFDADFDAQLGAAVPGGSGATTVKGTIKLAALQFAGAEGGRKLDVTLDTDLKGDAGAGDVQIDKLRLDFGPAGIAGHGRAKGLTSPTPRIEGLEITGHDLDPARLAAYYPPLRKMIAPNTVSGPVGLQLKASGTQAAQSLELRIDLTPVKLVVPEQLAKAAGAKMTLVAHAKGGASGGGPMKFDARLDLEGVDLRPGKSIDKKPGQRLDLALDGMRTAGKSSANPEQRIELSDLKAHILDDELEGHGFVEMKGAGAKKTTKFELLLASSGLDLDKMLIPSTAKEKEEKPLDPKAFAGLSGHASVKIDKLTMRKQTVTGIVADVTMVEDQIKVNTAQLKAFGGSASADGTEVRLAHPKEPFHVIAKLENVGLDNLVALSTDHKLLSGRFNGTIDLKGGGQELKDLAQTLAGVLEGHVLDGVFHGKDLVASVTGPLAKSLPYGVAGKEGQGGSTTLGKDLPFGVTLENGLAKLKNPIKISRPEAEMSFSGGIRVDGTLEMPGTVSLTPQTIAALTGGKVKPAQSIPISLKLVGPAWSPSVTDLDLKPAVSQIVKESSAAAVGRALGVDASKAQEAATQRAEDVQKQAQQKAAEEAEKQKKKLEEEAKNKLKGLFGK
jgi:AsmA protein